MQKKTKRIARLLCGVSISIVLAGPAHADEALRLLTLNVWNKFDQTPELTSDFMIAGDYDVLLFQEINGTRYVTDLPDILADAGLGTYEGVEEGSPGLISRLPGSFGVFTAPDVGTQGRHVPYTIVDGEAGRPATIIGTVHMDFSDEPTHRLAEARAISEWASGLGMPFILAGDFNAGDVAERGLHRQSQQEFLLRTYTKNPTNDFYYSLLEEYATDRAELNAFIDEWRGQDNAAIDAAQIPSGLFNDETYPVSGNTPQTMNVLKRQFMLLQTQAERERFAPHGLNDGSVTWPSAGEDATNVWGSWDRVRIDHFMVSRPFAKWYVIDSDPQDSYLGTIRDVHVELPDGSSTPLSDHEPVAHEVRWIGPRLETYSETVDGQTVESTRIVWDEEASTFADDDGVFLLTRNNMRDDVYLGQIADEDGMPILTGLTDDEKRTLLDCAGDDPRFAQAVSDYCIDDHGFIGQTLVGAGGTIVVYEDAALGSSDADLVLDGGRLRVVGTDMSRLDRDVVLGDAGGALDIAHAAGMLLIDRAIVGEGDLSKQGDGTLVLEGTHSYTGRTRVEGGRLVVEGSIAASSLTTVAQEGVLGGTGTLGNLTVAAGGVVAPGNSVGSLDVEGDLIFEAGSRYEVQVAPEGSQADHIAVSGTATLNGGSAAHIGMTGSYDPTSSYIILTAEEGLEGSFDEVTSVFVFLDPRLDYGARDVTLTLERNDISFEEIGVTPNQRSTAVGVDSLAFGDALYDAVVQLDETTARSAFDQLSGEIHGSVAAGLIEDSRHLRNAANDRIRSAFGAAGAPQVPVLAYGPDGAMAAPADAYHGLAGWGSAFGSWGSTDGDDNAAALDRSIGGFIAGLDGQVHDDWRVGVLAGYSRSSIDADDRASTASVDSFHLGLYGGTQWDALSLRGGLAYSWHDVETTRGVAFPGFGAETLSADYSAGTFQIFGEAGYALETGVARLEPFVNLAHISHRTGAYGEEGGDAALFSPASGTTDTTFTTLGIRAQTDIALGAMPATLSGMLGWRHAFGDTSPTATHAFAGSDAFTVSGAPIARDALVVEAGFDVDISGEATFGLSYQGQFASGAQDHGFNARLSVRF